MLAVGIGITLLRTADGLDPLSSASAEDLSVPLHELVMTVLGPAR